HRTYFFSALLGLRQDPRASVYVPLAQVSDRQAAFFIRLGTSMTWFIRADVNAHQLADRMQQEVRVATGGLPAVRCRSMDDVSTASTARDAFEMWLVTMFGTVAMLLAAIGLYGVISYSVD